MSKCKRGIFHFVDYITYYDIIRVDYAIKLIGYRWIIGVIAVIDYKKCEIANFNITFPNEDNSDFLPLMTHFEDIFLPALQQGYRIRYNGSDYFFADVKKIAYPNNDEAVVGMLIRDTQVEILSVVDPITNKIDYRDDRYQTSPFSSFILVLKNHRGMIIKNQNGSPTMSNFNYIVDKYLYKYVKSLNSIIRKESKESGSVPRYKPYANVNIIGIPSSKNLEKEFDGLESISQLTFRIYPLNPSPDFSTAFSTIRNEIHALQSSSSSVTINSIKNIKKAKDLVSESSGKFDFLLRGKRRDGTKAKITPETTTMQNEIALETSQGPVDIANQVYDSVQNTEIGEQLFANVEEGVL